MCPHVINKMHLSEQLSSSYFVWVLLKFTSITQGENNKTSGISVYSHSEFGKGHKQTTNYSGLLDLTGVPTFLAPTTQ